MVDEDGEEARVVVALRRTLVSVPRPAATYGVLLRILLEAEQGGVHLQRAEQVQLSFTAAGTNFPGICIKDTCRSLGALAPTATIQLQCGRCRLPVQQLSNCGGPNFGCN